MFNFIKGLIVFVVISGLGSLIFILCAQNGLLTPSEASLRAKYMLPHSRFVEIDGVPIHYVDEGTGDPIVLIHGQNGSLLMWNDWAKALSGHYRVIRFDRPPMGLSGPDPELRYDYEHEVRIIEQLTAKLGLDRFFLVATSSGGAPGTQYAAKHPEQIKGLILSNIAVAPPRYDLIRAPWKLKQIAKIDALFKVWHPPMLWRAVLENNMVDRDKITDALVAEWTDLNNRPAFYASMKLPRPPVSPFLRTPADLGMITVPTLVEWSADDGDTKLKPGSDDTMRLLGSQDKTLVVIQHCGHIMPIDCGAESASAAMSFFDRIVATAANK